jgi:hypothetical protein
VVDRNRRNQLGTGEFETQQAGWAVRAQPHCRGTPAIVSVGGSQTSRPKGQILFWQTVCLCVISREQVGPAGFHPLRACGMACAGLISLLVKLPSGGNFGCCAFLFVWFCLQNFLPPWSPESAKTLCRRGSPPTAMELAKFGFKSDNG